MDRRKKAAIAVAILLLILLIWFLSIRHEVDIEIEGEGTADPSDPVTGHLRSVEIRFEPASGWELKEVYLDGSIVDTEDGVLRIPLMVSDHRVRAVFVETESYHSLEVVTEGGGTADPLGKTAYRHGETAVVRMTPDAGHELKDVIVDGMSVGPRNPLELTMDSDHKVVVRFSSTGSGTGEDDIGGGESVDPSGFSVTVISYSGTKVTDGSIGSFQTECSIPLKEFRFDMQGIVPGISQTILIEAVNRTGVPLDLHLVVTDRSGDDILAEQIVLSSGTGKGSVKDVSGGSHISLGRVDGSVRFELTMTFEDRSDNNLAMGKELAFVMGVFAEEARR